jgi:hypothetical protein
MSVWWSVETSELWGRSTHGAWDLRARIESQDGSPVIAELRVLPSPSDRWVKGLASNPPETPPGGLTTRALRGMTLGDLLRFVSEELAATVEFESEKNPDAPVFHPAESRRFNWQDFDPGTLDAPRAPGRKGHPDSFYAAVAAAYLQALRAGSTAPVEDTAQSLNEDWRTAYKPPYFRDLLAEARRRELLTRPPAGRAGGELTDKGHAALKEGGES